jgi:hypothetical protein
MCLTPMTCPQLLDYFLKLELPAYEGFLVSCNQPLAAQTSILLLNGNYLGATGKPASYSPSPTGSFEVARKPRP